MKYTEIIKGEKYMKDIGLLSVKINTQLPHKHEHCYFLSSN